MTARASAPSRPAFASRLPTDRLRCANESKTPASPIARSKQKTSVPTLGGYGPLPAVEQLDGVSLRRVSDVPKVNMLLWRADPVVLFDWLMTVDLNAVPITHPAENQALTDLLARLEQETELSGVTQEEIDAARAEVARDMGW